MSGDETDGVAAAREAVVVAAMEWHDARIAYIAAPARQSEGTAQIEAGRKMATALDRLVLEVRAAMPCAATYAEEHGWVDFYGPCDDPDSLCPSCTARAARRETEAVR